MQIKHFGMKKLSSTYKSTILAFAILLSFNDINAQSRFNIHHEQLKYTCSNGENAELRVWASDNNNSTATYKYKWLGDNIKPIQLSENNQHVIGLKAYTNYVLEVTQMISLNDSVVQIDTIQLKAYPNPTIEISSDPQDTVYLDNPYVTWWFTLNPNPHDSIIEISNFFWEFEGYEQTFTDERPTVTYSETENDHTITKLHVTSDYGCDTTYTDNHLWILPVKLKIPNIFTPNGDGVNDYFEIGYGDEGKPINDLNDYFLSHKLTVINRWGRVVYESKDYKNDWDGGSLPDGTYFYVLECKGKTQDYRYQGSVMIWNSGR